MGRKNAERYQQQIQACSRARNAALRRLIALHKEEYERIYKEEANREGITTQAERRKKKIQRLRDEINQLENGGQSL